MDKDNEIYVTSNGELYKKGVEQAINPQTNYTTQQFYTKEEYDKLQAENKRLKEELRVAQMNRMTMFEKLDIVNEKDTYKQALQEIRCVVDKNISFMDTSSTTKAMIRIQDKINEVIGAEE